MADSMSSVAIVIPALNEETALPALIENIATLDPAPNEVILVDGGSDDQTGKLARAAGWTVLQSPQPGRGPQVNHGVQSTSGDLVCVLHADTHLPADALSVIAKTLADDATALASFTPRFVGPKGTRWPTTAHNWLKTWYAPLLFRPQLYFRGVRLLFGDHAMFFRRRHFIQLGGCDERLAIMEDADLCIKFASLGKIRLVPRFAETSDRRIAKTGRLKSYWTYLNILFLWARGARERLGEHYPQVR
ncbi:glycosyltransferase [Altererythrobacter sp. MF3-039]|uniref:glycosyltransferase n=1 Tax=Altererythrobacter sp. MF3-039 TaxID=3252901 RepID=UPI00390C4ADD